MVAFRKTMELDEIELLFWLPPYLYYNFRACNSRGIPNSLLCLFFVNVMVACGFLKGCNVAHQEKGFNAK